MLVYGLLLLPTLALAANPARMSSSWASQRERQNAKQVSERKTLAAAQDKNKQVMRRDEEPITDSSNGETVELYDGEFEALGYPKTLAIYLSGEASKVQGGRAGVFIQTNKTRHDRPVWKQEPGNKQWLFFSDFGHWMVGGDPASNIGGLGSSQQGLDVVPAKGWKFFTKAKQWIDDPTISVTKLEEADIMHLGKTVEGRREGLYIRQGSQFGRGVWHQIVGETAEQGTSNLHFNCNGFWYIYNLLDFNKLDKFYASEKADLASPPETLWDMWSSTLVDLVVTSEVSGKNEDYPETLRISVGANSTTNKAMENRLGVYQRTNSTRNGRPEWEQKEGGKNSLYFDCNGYWFIWPEDQKDLGGFQLREKGKSGLPFDLASWIYVEGTPTEVIVEPVQVVEGSCELTDNCKRPKSCHELWGGVACYTN